MKSTAQLIKRARRTALDLDADANRGVPDQNYVDYLGDALEHLASLVFAEFPEYYEKQEEISLVANQREYSLSAEIFNPTAVRLVEYSDDGTSKRYRPLEFRTFLELDNDTAGSISACAVREGKVTISPVISTSLGKLRVTYYRKPYRPEIRRGAISGTTSTTMTLAASGPAPDASLIGDVADNGGQVSVVDAAGTVVASNLAVTAYNSGTRVLTGSFSTYTFAAGHYMVFGPYATTHPNVPASWERFLVKYCASEVLANDKAAAKERVMTIASILMAIEEDIVDAIRNSAPAIQQMPQLRRY